MDLRTGQMYSTREEAIAAGVPASDLMQVDLKKDGSIRLAGETLMKALGVKKPSKHQPHQGNREMARRARRALTTP